MTRVDGHRIPEPRAGLISREFGAEYVVVDPRTGAAHWLAGDAAVVWRWVQGGAQRDLSSMRVDEVVGELVGLGLLRPDGLSRRSLLKSGAKGGAALALMDVMSVALPPSISMSSNVVNMLQFDVGDSPATVNVPAGVTVTFTLVGGGGGSGGAANEAGGDGGDGASITGSLTNTSGQTQTLTVVVGGGGGAGGDGGAGGSSAGAGGQSFSTGGSGNGGGGGASAVLQGSTVLVVAGGGGGGATYGPGSPAGTSNSGSYSAQNGAAGTHGAGGAGGGAGVTTSPTGNFELSGGQGGASYWSSGGDFTVSGGAAGSDADNTGGYNGSGGSNGYATFTGLGISSI